MAYADYFHFVVSVEFCLSSADSPSAGSANAFQSNRTGMKWSAAARVEAKLNQFMAYADYFHLVIFVEFCLEDLST